MDDTCIQMQWVDYEDHNICVVQRMFSTGSYVLYITTEPWGREKDSFEKLQMHYTKTMHAVLHRNYTVCDYTHITQTYVYMRAYS